MGWQWFMLTWLMALYAHMKYRWAPRGFLRIWPRSAPLSLLPQPALLTCLECDLRVCRRRQPGPGAIWSLGEQAWGKHLFETLWKYLVPWFTVLWGASVQNPDSGGSWCLARVRVCNCAWLSGHMIGLSSPYCVPNCGFLIWVTSVLLDTKNKTKMQ